MYKLRQLIAIIRYYLGEVPCSSTFIDEIHITYGFGELDAIGVFKYDLPQWIIKKDFNGTNSWTEYMDILNAKTKNK